MKQIKKKKKTCSRLVCINKYGLSCFIYDPTLVEIHQSIGKLDPKVYPFSQQQQPDSSQTTVDKVIPNVCVLPAKAGNIKTDTCRINFI